MKFSLSLLKMLEMWDKKKKKNSLTSCTQNMILNTFLNAIYVLLVELIPCFLN